MTGLWGNAAICYNLITTMHTNAYNDMITDPTGMSIN